MCEDARRGLKDTIFSGVGDEESEEATAQALKLLEAASPAASASPVQWQVRPDGGLLLQHNHSLAQITWHSRGDYFATVAPTGNTQVDMDIHCAQL